MASVFERPGDEISLYQQITGRVNGSILYAMATLSDAQEMTDPSDILQEVNEAKEVLTSVLDFLLKS